ncbi:MAG TPA: HXXEE domain-containing protein [Gemmatimonadales bacterium]|nr:HXXEE domain-containing protein [Gemmatimonadales bacterium]
MTRLRALGLLLPLTFAAHIAEEYWGGFPAWASAQVGLALTEPAWLSLNIQFFGVMTVGVIAALLADAAQWLLIPLGTAVLINGIAHVAASLITRSYSPGVITGALLWIPLGLAIIRAARQRWRRPVVLAGVLVGVGLHILVPLSAYLVARG